MYEYHLAFPSLYIERYSILFYGLNVCSIATLLEDLTAVSGKEMEIPTILNYCCVGIFLLYDCLVRCIPVSLKKSLWDRLVAS